MPTTRRLAFPLVPGVFAPGVFAARALLALALGGCASDVDGQRCDATYETPASFDPALASALQAVVQDRLPASGAPGATLTVHVPALDDTSEEQHEGRDCAMSEGYVVTGGAATDDIDMSWAWAAGGLVSSGVDLCAWFSALYQGDVLTPGARASLVVPSAESITAGERYGLGTQLTSRGGRPVVGHTGSTMGFNGEVFIDLESGVCVAVLLNDFVSTPSAIARPAWDAVFAALEP